MASVILQTSNYLGSAHTTGSIVGKVAEKLNSEESLQHVICFGPSKQLTKKLPIRNPAFGMGTAFKAMNALGKVSGIRSLNNYRKKIGLFDRFSLRHVQPCDIFHSWDSTPQCFSKAKRLGAKTVLEIEMSIWGMESYDDIDAMFVPSKYLYNEALKLGIDEARLYYQPFGVDTEYFHPPESDSDFTIKRFLFSGALNHRKGIKELLEAWRQADIENAELILCGRSTPYFRQLLREQKPNNVKVLGFLTTEQLREEYQKAYCFVFPSKKEGSAKVIYEALACGLPVITTVETGSIITDGTEGFIVDKDDTASIASKMVELREDPALRTRLAEAARIAAEKNTWKHYQERTIANYEKILSQ